MRYFNCSLEKKKEKKKEKKVKFWPLEGKFDLGGQRSENEKCVELTIEAAYKIWWRYLYWFYSYFNCSLNVKKRSSFDLLTGSLTLEVKGQKMKYVWNWPVKLYIKFGEDISIGSKVISIVLLISYRRTDGQTDGRTDGRTDGWTDKVSHRGAPLLKILWIFQMEKRGTQNQVIWTWLWQSYCTFSTNIDDILF